ncbi:hypothetical protein [Alteromonas sp. S015]|uniref:hypothetical protein n=1 Tax=Alteromonas sp. S015 TaxID=3117401 RepID=UPI002FE11265
MKPIFSIVFLTIFGISFSSSAEKLFSVSSSERGITAFDFKVTEVKRAEDFSVLKIPGFQTRSASASRWMMCVYTELAILRDKEMWASIYTDNSGDDITIVFPESSAINDPAFKNVDLLGTQPQVTPVNTFKKFCGLK